LPHLFALFLLLAAAPGQVPMPAPPSPVGGTGAAASNGSEAVARESYKTGLALFDTGDKAQALVEFQRAYDLTSKPEILIMIAHCEYHLGALKQARAHYEEFLSHETRGMWAEIARQRIEAIKRRQGVIVVQTVPDGVDVTIERLDGPAKVVTGQAPNQFPVDAGRWRVTVRKASYKPASNEVTIDSVDTKPLFFALERLPAHLEIRTEPEGATLYVRGNRARNPYVQDVEPGAYEIYAEATSYESRTETFYVAPGERRKLRFPLRYVQRSGRPELIGFWTAAGATAGAGLVYARLTAVDKNSGPIAPTSLMAGGALVGGVAGALFSTAYLPDYIPDNRALFRIGSAWIGAAEGAVAAAAVRPSSASAWLGGALGLGLGAASGKFFETKAPNYGRVAVIQSGAAAGLLAGALAVPALASMEICKPAPTTEMPTPPGKDCLEGTANHSPLVLLGGLNLGLAAGLALSYLPDQSAYGPTWKRAVLVDLAIAAGTVAGTLFRVVGQCLAQNSAQSCSYQTDDPRGRRLTARFALAGGAVGLIAGLILTRDFDRYNSPPLEREPVARLLLPTPAMLPVTSSDGGTQLVPGLAAQGRF
jgi:tetratricopeptide (TPR) repeat protein